MDEDMKKAIKIAEDFGVKVWDNNHVSFASWSHGKQIEVNFNKVKEAYPILHELGHVFCGYGCCREHDEYVAHGFALGLAKAYGIKISESALKSIDAYAGYSSHDACGVLEKNG